MWLRKLNPRPPQHRLLCSTSSSLVATTHVLRPTGGPRASPLLISQAAGPSLVVPSTSRHYVQLVSSSPLATGKGAARVTALLRNPLSCVRPAAAAAAAARRQGIALSAQGNRRAGGARVGPNAAGGHRQQQQRGEEPPSTRSGQLKAQFQQAESTGHRELVDVKAAADRFFDILMLPSQSSMVL
jgi:hypothetical protein